MDLNGEQNTPFTIRPHWNQFPTRTLFWPGMVEFIQIKVFRILAVGLPNFLHDLKAWAEFFEGPVIQNLHWLCVDTPGARGELLEQDPDGKSSWNSVADLTPVHRTSTNLGILFNLVTPSCESGNGSILYEFFNDVDSFGT